MRGPRGATCPAPRATKTIASAPSRTAARKPAPSSPRNVGTIGTRASSAGGSASGCGRSRARRRSARAPRRRCRSGPLAGEPNAAGEVEETLRTARAACSSPAKQTIAPRPSVSAAPAAATASRRFAGPSAPGAPDGLIAPVSTIGSPAGVQDVAQHRGLLDRVGAVRDDDPAPAAASSPAARAIAKASALESCAPGSSTTDLVARSGTPASARNGGHQRIDVQRGPRARPGHRDRAAGRQDGHRSAKSRPRADGFGADPAANLCSLRLAVPCASSEALPISMRILPPQADGLYDPLRARRVWRRARRAPGQRPVHEVVDKGLQARREPRAPRRHGRRLAHRRRRRDAPADARTRSSARTSTSSCPTPARYGVAVCFLPHDDQRRAKLEALLELNVRVEGQACPRLARHPRRPRARRRDGQRDAPGHAPALRRGRAGLQTRPGRLRAQALRHPPHRASWPPAPTSTSPSFSSRTIVYKGMLDPRPGPRLLPGPAATRASTSAHGARALALLDEHVPELGRSRTRTASSPTTARSTR